ncbi:uncharacterized protein LOC132304842 [Cornus florida]|uniref:uncharacterized protein LOC132304842 n=1 Tax=Cornus florida TaxID=4283 RepID=UPI0028A0A4B1|nr:uncharacterized protein LOC132304842 [Cornus florida]
MPIADQLIDTAAKYEIMYFMDGHPGYNQIYIAEEDIQKTALRCPGSIGTFEWVVMPSGLKKAGFLKYMLSRLLITGRIGKWALALMEFNFAYVPQKAIKERALANFLADHPSIKIEPQVFDELDLVKMLTSTPYYAQGNGQAEVSNKIVIEIIENIIKDKPRRWHDALSEALWAYRNSKRTSTATTPYRLTFGHDAVLLMELNVKLARVALQHNLIPTDYNEATLAELEDLDEIHKLVLDHLMVHKAKVMKAYNKRVKFKSFAKDDMVWQIVLPPGKVDRIYGK